jgi:N-acetylmuramoyl-L-alanine amidase
VRFRPAIHLLLRATLALALPAATALAAAPAVAAAVVSVEGVTWDAARQAYVVKASGELAPRVRRLASPARLVIDLPNAKLVPSHQALDGVPGSGVTRVRVGQFQATTTRIVLDLARAIEIDVEAGGHELVIPLRAAAGAAPAPAQATASVVDVPTIRGIRHRNGDFAIQMSQRSPYWSHVQPSSGQTVRYLLVFPNTKLAPGAAGSVPIGSHGVQRVTSTQVGSEARIEFELSKAPTFDVQATTQGWHFLADRARSAEAPAAKATPRVAAARKPAERLSAKPRGPKAGTPDAARPAPARPAAEPGAWTGASDAPLALRKVDGHWQMMLTADSRFKFTTTAVGDDRVRVDIEGGKVPLPRDSVYIDNGLIARVRVNSQSGGTTRLTIDLDQPVRHTARLLGNQRSLLLGFHRVGKERVTLDPGHGGSDHGTTGRKGTREKDVTLAIASRVARMMEAGGMSVQMTRMKDLEILLRPRVEMANRNDADVFVSIHANSFGRQHGVNGIETYYFSDESYPLAKSIHKSLLRSLGRPDRGVRKNNFYVVHHTKMPAALIEIGYLSNPEEEALLASPAYQEKAAQAIYAGIREFMAARKAQH